MLRGVEWYSSREPGSKSRDCLPLADHANWDCPSPLLPLLRCVISLVWSSSARFQAQVSGLSSLFRKFVFPNPYSRHQSIHWDSRHSQSVAFYPVDSSRDHARRMKTRERAGHLLLVTLETIQNLSCSCPTEARNKRWSQARESGQPLSFYSQILDITPVTRFGPLTT